MPSPRAAKTAAPRRPPRAAKAAAAPGHAPRGGSAAPRASSCAVLVGSGPDGRFAHLASAWCLGGGDWVTAWSQDDAPAGAQLLLSDGSVHAVRGWECEDGIAGFSASARVEPLSVATRAPLAKGQALAATGFASLVDHPAFAIAHGSLDPARYLPWLCPWTVAGALVAFSSSDGWMSGQAWAGMGGAPVLRGDGAVVGVLLDSCGGGAQPPLCRFRRLA
jgi:hypothetical protein